MAIRRLISNAWLAAPPLVILLAAVVAFALIDVASAIIARLAGTQASDNFVAEIMTLFGMLVLFTPLAIALYALVALARWMWPEGRTRRFLSRRAALIPCDYGGCNRKEKRPPGSMPTAFSCNCRFPEPGSVAIPMSTASCRYI